MSDTELLAAIRRVVREELRFDELDGSVYFAQCTACLLVKVGFSRDVGDRLGNLRCPRRCRAAIDLLEEIPGSRSLERRLHGQLARWRFMEPRHVARGRLTDGQREWFDFGAPP